ncbi:protein-disulfide reductase DsbD family protein [Candidatus Phycosocius spiralis]|uniref:Thiol:disulfide interchange protein DsbD n=1 Tax=Candidatus Phycosocius spiralis TaxID=2815099 RepID=A0ABQ4PTZ2_9PROT|nr:protein-disulfide reductase DsbD domain-containing protein [Candidatus Phycosocius spiralis]GIU66480.1 thiol:disulfide interchange protein DsbD [Candidatus Phycosocius spiralis]
MKSVLIATMISLSLAGYANAQIASSPDSGRVASMQNTPAFSIQPRHSPTARSANVEIELISERAAVRPGEVFHVAIRQVIAPDWHTYWRNPGDSGEPTQLRWTLSNGVKAGPIQWPKPSAIPFGPLVNYGFSNEVILPIEISVPSTAKPDTSITLEAAATWLECSDVCIPGEGQISLTLPVASKSIQAAAAQEIGSALLNLPKPFPGQAHLTRLDATKLQLVLSGIKQPDIAYFFPYEFKLGALIDFAKPQELVRGDTGFAINLVQSPSLPDPLVGPIRGVLVLGKGSNERAYEVQGPVQSTPPLSSSARSLTISDTGKAHSFGLLQAVVMAFVGGLILNLMPCVFPILSMKALGLIQASHGDKTHARMHGLFYGFGVMVSFLSLACLLIGLKTAGMAAGWGFQLQSPIIVTGLAILMVLIGFNLLGFFEIGTTLQNAGTGLASTGGNRGSFFTGILAVVVAAPCTAPFMGVALGYAATQPAGLALLVFAALGLGFALPFMGLTWMPALLNALPRPGPWMARLREALAFPMFATAIWLIWVLGAQVGQFGVVSALIGVLACGMTIWIVRWWNGLIGKVCAGAILALGLGWAAYHVSQAPSQAATASRSQLSGEPWTPARVKELQGRGKTIFVNFTADWCVTCKVNEATVFSDPAVRAALKGDTIVYLVADWTKRDDTIAQALASHGRVGVPLYLVYKLGSSEPIILPQLLDSKTFIQAIQ